ncbi:OpgC domain-containing protein, partial [Stenotrophomonas maltophilia]
DNPLILEWHNAGGFFGDPIQTVVGVALLTHQLGFFNILPLYVVLLGVAPLFVIVARYSRLAALGLSLAL